MLINMGNSHNLYMSRTVVLAKRLFDVSVSVTALILTVFLWPIIALVIKLESPGPVFYRQMRVGRALENKTEIFFMIKFRTMVDQAEKKSGAVWAAKNDHRITQVGKFLRKTRLDELPQLVNVLKNEMSIVGPRPERPGISQKLNQAIPYYIERTYMVTPGITGLAQINQGYDTCLNDVRIKIGYDHAYSLVLTNFFNWLRMDLKIVLATFTVMITGRGR